MPAGDKPRETTETTEPGEGQPGRRSSAHEHRIPVSSEWPWLPTQNCGHLAKHPYCPDCGQVKAVGTSAALDFGGLVNVMANLKRHMRNEGLKLTDVQKRLILKEVRARELDDRWALTRERQRELLAEIVAKYLHLHTDTALEYLKSC